MVLGQIWNAEGINLQHNLLTFQRKTDQYHYYYQTRERALGGERAVDARTERPKLFAIPNYQARANGDCHRRKKIYIPVQLTTRRT